MHDWPVACTVRRGRWSLFYALALLYFARATPLLTPHSARLAPRQSNSTLLFQAALFSFYRRASPSILPTYQPASPSLLLLPFSCSPPPHALRPLPSILSLQRSLYDLIDRGVKVTQPYLGNLRHPPERGKKVHRCKTGLTGLKRSTVELQIQV